MTVKIQKFVIDVLKNSLSTNKILRTSKKERVNGCICVRLQVSHPEAYGQFSITSNGQSLMNFQMDLSAVTIMNSIPVKKVEVASWDAIRDKSLDVKDAPKMVKHSAVTVYRIVTVVVIGFLISL